MGLSTCSLITQLVSHLHTQLKLMLLFTWSTLFNLLQEYPVVPSRYQLVNLQFS